MIGKEGSSIAINNLDNDTHVKVRTLQNDGNILTRAYTFYVKTASEVSD